MSEKRVTGVRRFPWEMLPPDGSTAKERFSGIQCRKRRMRAGLQPPQFTMRALAQFARSSAGLKPPCPSP